MKLPLPTGSPIFTISPEAMRHILFVTLMSAAVTFLTQLTSTIDVSTPVGMLIGNGIAAVVLFLRHFLPDTRGPR